MCFPRSYFEIATGGAPSRFVSFRSVLVIEDIENGSSEAYLSTKYDLFLAIHQRCKLLLLILLMVSGTNLIIAD